MQVLVIKPSETVQLVQQVNTDLEPDLQQFQAIVWPDTTENHIHFLKCLPQIHQPLLKLINDMDLELQDTTVLLQLLLQLHALLEHTTML